MNCVTGGSGYVNIIQSKVWNKEKTGYRARSLPIILSVFFSVI